MNVFVTGGTGYIGTRAIEALLARGHIVRALVRLGSESRLPRGCEVITGNALDAATFAHALPPSDTLLHLVGTPHPGPAKEQQFRDVDLVSVRASVRAAADCRPHFVYVSVAQPAPIMRAYVAVRAQGEAMIRDAGLTATFLRPWYVLGPGHRWAHVLAPFYWLAERLPSKRDTARRLGLITLRQFVAAIVDAVEHPPEGTRVVEVPEMKAH